MECYLCFHGNAFKGAWGGGLLLSSKYRHLLHGIHRYHLARSLTCITLVEFLYAVLLSHEFYDFHNSNVY